MSQPSHKRVAKQSTWLLLLFLLRCKRKDKDSAERSSQSPVAARRNVCETTQRSLRKTGNGRIRCVYVRCGEVVLATSAKIDACLPRVSGIPDLSRVGIAVVHRQLVIKNAGSGERNVRVVVTKNQNVF